MNDTMLTDLYQLTMAAAYTDSGKADAIATFDLFARKLPEGWGYMIAAGIESAIEYATSIRFDESDIDYLRSLDLFSDTHLERLRSMRFTGDIAAVPEGTPVAPGTPIMRVTGPLAEAQLLESRLLNIVNQPSLVASKTSRIVHAAGDAAVVEFGMRRSHGADAAIEGARAAYIGGAAGTSNVLAGKRYGIPVKGTHAHSFVMSFASEAEAFEAYAATYPGSSTLLIDTYDTLGGAAAAIEVAKRLERDGHRLGAVRLDSGDIAALSQEVRSMLDREGLEYVRIMASNDLNEHKIARIREAGGKVDAYGVGTEMITGKPDSALPVVYKLVEDEDGPKMKLAPGKQTYPGRKQVYRIADAAGNLVKDILALEGEAVGGTPLLATVVRNGERIAPARTLEEIRAYSLAEVARLPQESRGLYATPYALEASPGLRRLAAETAQRYAPRAGRHDAS